MKLLKIFVIAILCLSVLVPVVSTRADELDDITKELNDVKKALELSQKATTPLEAEVKNLEKRLFGVKTRLSVVEKDLRQKERDLKDAENALSVQKQIMDQRIKKHYKAIKSVENDIASIFFTPGVSSDIRSFFYQKKTADNDKEIILRMVNHIVNIEERRSELQKEQNTLAFLKKDVDTQSQFLTGEITKAKGYQAELSKKIAELSEKQQQIVNARSGSVITSVGSVPIGSDYNASIAFKGQAPGNSFAVFSFGAYTHRNGMSQYGAKARADKGQSAKDILAAYFPGANLNENYAIPDTIDVQGYGNIPFKDYLLGIYEMPESWPMEALKAQAVLARTYAIRSGKPICTTEACQVFKNEPKSGNWKKAVEETEKWVLENTPNSQYSSTSGGYLNNSGWDTTDKAHGGDWTSKAYESMAGSPWFYKAWYRKGYQNSSDSCGRSHPWLSQEEFSDIINAWIVRKNPNGADTNRIIPVTISSCSVGGASGSPYSMQEMRDLANKSGGAVTSVSSVTITNNDQGQTTQVSLQTNRGSLSISGSEFKETFNIRAPGYISIPQKGFAFFNIEKN